MRKQVFIVEGRHDASKLKEVLGDIHVMTTNGSEISKETLNLIKVLSETHDLIVFTDPDYAGERIRKMVTKDLDNVYHAFLEKDVARSRNKKKIGIEHANKADIRQALSHMKLAVKTYDSDINRAFLYDMGFIGHMDSQHKRDRLSATFGLGQVNGKTLLKRLQMFGINQQNIKEVMDESST